MNMKLRLIVMNFLQFAVWGAYLTSMGTYLAGVGLGGHIGIFYAMQGVVSLFMPAVLGIIADRWVPAQRSTVAGAEPSVGCPVYGWSGLLCHDYGTAGGICTVVLVLLRECGVLHAYAGFVEFGGLYGAG